MSFESLMGVSQRLGASVETLAALGAQLRFLENGLDGDSRMRTLVSDVARAIDPQLLEGVEKRQQASVLALIRTTFRQGLDLLENPERAPGWSYQDPDILQSQGQLSLARKNLAESGLVERVEFRSQRVEQFEETETFTVAWVPGPFISAGVVDRALERVRNALVPGGWLIFGFYPLPGAPVEQALVRLRIVRGGGYPWTAQEVEEKLRALALEQIEVYSPAPPVSFVLAQRPK
jgi:hypothetical protein